MTETHISWERIRALRAAGVLADFRPRTLYGSDQPILLVHCGDHRLLRNRHEFLRDGGIAFNSWSFPGGILNCDPQRSDREELSYALWGIEHAVELHRAKSVLVMADTPCLKAERRSYDADELIASALEGTRTLRDHLHAQGFTGTVEPALHTRCPQTGRERTYHLRRLKYAETRPATVSAAGVTPEAIRGRPVRPTV